MRSGPAVVGEPSRVDPDRPDGFRAYLFGVTNNVAADAERTGIPLRRVYHLLDTGRSQFRSCLLHVMAKYHPSESEAELEHRCAELVGSV